MLNKQVNEDRVRYYGHASVSRECFEIVPCVEKASDELWITLTISVLFAVKPRDEISKRRETNKTMASKY